MPAVRRSAPGRRLAGRLATLVVCVLAGFVVTASTLSARGTDLRPGRTTDLAGLVRTESRRNAELARWATELRVEVDRLSADTEAGPARGTGTSLDALATTVGLRPVTGPAVTVTLDDAPDSVRPVGVDEDLLVVHQQDIQAVANALWSAGAEAMTIQGQRVIATTGLKCVGNTVVLHGIPYAPPYVVRAIGDPVRLRSALATAGPVRTYRQYADAYGLRYSERTDPRAVFPGYSGRSDLRYARPS